MDHLEFSLSGRKQWKQSSEGREDSLSLNKSLLLSQIDMWLIVVSLSFLVCDSYCFVPSSLHQSSHFLSYEHQSLHTEYTHTPNTHIHTWSKTVLQTKLRRQAFQVCVAVAYQGSVISEVDFGGKLSGRGSQEGVEEWKEYILCAWFFMCLSCVSGNRRLQAESTGWFLWWYYLRVWRPVNRNHLIF